MHNSIRLALPVVATVTALALAGCADDDGHGTFGAIGGGGDSAPMDPGDLSDDALDDIEPPSAIDGGTDAGSTDGGLGDIGGTDGGLTDGGLTAGGTGGDASGSYIGDWYVDPNDPNGSHNIDITPYNVYFTEDMGSEGDMCFSGTLSGNTLQLGGCVVYGSQEWTDMTATLTLNPDGTLQVVWASGLTETYYRAR